MKIKQDSISSKIVIKNIDTAQMVAGECDSYLHYLGRLVGVDVYPKGNVIEFKGDPSKTNLSKNIVEQLSFLVEKGYLISQKDYDFAYNLLVRSPKTKLADIFLDAVCITTKKKIISPKTLNQKRYIQAIRENDIVFGIGPAGTGKTYLAMAMAVSALIKKEVGKIILARPAVEAGERLGFLPGDLYEKVNPYLRPLYDALYDMMEYEKAAVFIEKGVIEVAPLAFMRGRTLTDAFVILDEAQNSTPEQMKMLLTRLGFGSKAVITGDITQIDLPEGKISGLIQAQQIFTGISRINTVYFNEKDVVRHPIVQEVIKAYDRLIKKKIIAKV